LLQKWREEGEVTSNPERGGAQKNNKGKGTIQKNDCGSDE